MLRISESADGIVVVEQVSGPGVATHVALQGLRRLRIRIWMPTQTAGSGESNIGFAATGLTREQQRTLNHQGGIGGGYEVGPWGFAVSYAEDEYDFAAQISETSAYQAGVDYLLPSGIMVGGGVQQIEFDGDLDLDKSDEETVIYMETMISF